MLMRPLENTVELESSSNKALSEVAVAIFKIDPSARAQTTSCGRADQHTEQC